MTCFASDRPYSRVRHYVEVLCILPIIVLIGILFPKVEVRNNTLHRNLLHGLYYSYNGHGGMHYFTIFATCYKALVGFVTLLGATLVLLPFGEWAQYMKPTRTSAGDFEEDFSIIQ